METGPLFDAPWNGRSHDECFGIVFLLVSRYTVCSASADLAEDETTEKEEPRCTLNAGCVLSRRKYLGWGEVSLQYSTTSPPSPQQPCLLQMGEKRVSAELGSRDAQGQGLGYWVVVGRKLQIAPV